MDFLNIDLKILWLVGILIFSIIIHEVSHGYAALFQGDHTAENQGRLTLNPIPHIDLVGSILLPGFLILSGSQFFLGWAKPVPYNPNNLKNKKWGESIVAIAGPLSNIVLSFIFLIILWFLNTNHFGTIITFNLLESAIFMNLFLAIFNLLPIPPLDGSKIFFTFLPYNINQKIKLFMDKNYLIIFITFIIFLYQTNFLINTVSFMHTFLINLFFN